METTKTRKPRHRESGKGRIVTAEYAAENPLTTTAEIVRRRPSVKRAVRAFMDSKTNSLSYATREDVEQTLMEFGAFFKKRF